MSDGTGILKFLDPSTFKVKRRIEVKDRGSPLSFLNELEYIQGEIWANIWQRDQIARISPRTGRVTGWIDLKGLRELAGVRTPDAVLNGIAYDPAGGRIFVTGKNWSRLFEIRLTETG
jgi:glutamine cyclotransferase